MGAKRYIAVIRIDKQDDYKKVVPFASGVVSAMNTNVAIFAAANPTTLVIAAQIVVVNGYVAQVVAGDHSKIPYRDEACITLFKMLQQEIIYVNSVANGDKAIIEASGFKASKEPAPAEVPMQVVIKRIVDGVTPGTAKIYIGSMGQTRLTFIVQMATAMTPAANFVTVVTTGSSHKLIIPDMVHGQQIWIRIQASSSSGTGVWSVVVPFISQN